MTCEHEIVEFHVTASEGSAAPLEAIKEAHRRGIRVVAITDHDSMRGVEEAMQAGDARIDDDGALPRRFKLPVTEEGP